MDDINLDFSGSSQVTKNSSSMYISRNTCFSWDLEGFDSFCEIRIGKASPIRIPTYIGNTIIYQSDSFHFNFSHIALNCSITFYHFKSKIFPFLYFRRSVLSQELQVVIITKVSLQTSKFWLNFIFSFNEFSRFKFFWQKLTEYGDLSLSWIK